MLIGLISYYYDMTVNKMNEEKLLRLLVPINNLVQNINLEGLVQDETEDCKQLAKENGLENLPILSNPIFRRTTMLNSGIFAPGYCPFGFVTSYADDVIGNSKTESVIEAINYFKDQIVIDLGAGKSPAGYSIADIAKARGYVAVEPNFMDILLCEMSFLPSTFMYNKIPFVAVEEDMLSFLKRLPNNSVSLFSAGIDWNVIPNKSYRDQVAREIVRVLNPEGAYVGDAFGGHIELDDRANQGIQKIERWREEIDEHGVKPFGAYLTIYRKGKNEERGR